MTYVGHVKNGVVVLDDAPPLEEGMLVRVELVVGPAPALDYNALRNMPYVFHDPLAPAAPAEEWDALR